MIDWNGNGKIDPVDVGISSAMIEDEETETETETEPEKKRKGGGCMTAFAPALSIAGGLIWVAGRMLSC